VYQNQAGTARSNAAKLLVENRVSGSGAVSGGYRKNVMSDGRIFGRSHAPIEMPFGCQTRVCSGVTSHRCRLDFDTPMQVSVAEWLARLTAM